MSRWPVRISQTGSGPTPPGDSQDRFAPKYLVGNTQAPYNDSAVAYNTDGFRYIPDTGNGAGIAAALLAANAGAGGVAGDVWIRPGTYNFGLTDSPVTPLTIPSGVRVQGAGFNGVDGTILRAKSGVDESQSVFKIEDFAQLQDLAIVVPESGGGGFDDYVVKVQGFGVTIANVAIVASMTTALLTTLRYLLYISVQDSGPPVSLENVFLINVTGAQDTPSDSSLLLVQRGQVSARYISATGGGHGIEVANAAVSQGGNSQCSLRADDVFIDLSRSRGIFYHEVAGEGQAPGTVKVHRAQIKELSLASHGVELDSGEAHTLSDCMIDLGNINGSVGVGVGSQTGSCTDVLVTGCKVLARGIGVLFFATGENLVTRGSVTDCDIEVDDPFSDRTGIYIVNASEISATSNNISAQGSSQGFTTRAVWVVNSSDVLIDDNVIKTSSAQALAGAAVDLGSGGQPPFGGPVQRVTVSGNNIITSERFAVRAQGGQSKWIVVSDNNIRTFQDNVNFRPVSAILSVVARTAITGNVIDHGSVDQVPPTGSAVVAAGDRCTVSGNTVEMNSGSNDAAIVVQGTQTACTGNSIGLTGQYPVAAILLLNTSSSCTCVSNACGTVPPVDDQGALNEVAHNI